MTNLPNSHFKFFEDFFNSFVEGLFILKDFKIVFINQLAISYLKLKSHEEIIGKGLELFTPEFQPNGKNSFEYIGENIQRMSQNGHTEFEMFHQDILGELFLVHVKITVFHYEGENYQVGIWQEVQNFSKEKNIFGRSLEEVKGLIQSIDESSIISVIDRNENFTSVNKLFTEVLGYEEKEVLGKNIKMIYPESEEQKFNAILTSSLNSKKIWGGEVANKKKDGSIIWFKATIVPVLDKYGEIESFITHRQDITELKLQQEENWKQLQFQANINKSTDNLIIKMRTNGMIEYINSAGEKVLGLNFIDVIDTMSPTDFFIKDEIDQKIIDLNLKFKSNVQTGLECLLYKTQRGIKNEDEWTVLSKEDKIYTIKFKIDNIYDQNQNPDGYILVGVDITERKNNEEILLKAKQTAESSLKFKNEYMARLSHEVKTPLNGILGMVDLLENTEINSEQKNYLETIQKSSFRLLGLINKTLEYEKVESGKFELHERQFSIKNEIQKIEQDFSPQCVSKNIAFKITNKLTDDLFIADDKRISQVLHYLLENAVRFTTKGHISLTISSNLDGSILFEVRDTGTGIDINREKYIFTPYIFNQESLTDDFNGLGLSLAISSKIVEGLNGLIGFKTSQGHGSLFWLKIPVSIANKEIEISKDFDSNNSQDLSKTLNLKILRVLIVEDDLINQRLLKKMLNKLNIYPEVVSNGLEALEIQAAQKFSLIFMDINMPIIDGLEATKKIRSDSNLYGNPYIVAVTANSIVGDEDECFKVGMNNYLAKPIKRDSLIEVLQLVLGKEEVATPIKKNSHSKFYIRKLEEQFTGDEEILNEFILQIINKVPDRIEKLEMALKQNEFEEIRLESIKLKELIGSLYHEELRSELEALENYGTEKKFRNIYPMFIDMRIEILLLLDELKFHFIKEAA